jgi:hypothetical protein
LTTMRVSGPLALETMTTTGPSPSVSSPSPMNRGNAR